MAVKKYYVTVNEEGTTRWYKDAECTVLHREDGPAIEWNDGGKFWYQNGLLHRTDGPAVEYTTGGKFWYQNGLRHRTDGAASEYDNGCKRWFIHGVEMTATEFLTATQPTIEMTVADVEKLVGKRVKIVK